MIYQHIENLFLGIHMIIFFKKIILVFVVSLCVGCSMVITDGLDVGEENYVKSSGGSSGPTLSSISYELRVVKEDREKKTKNFVNNSEFKELIDKCFKYVFNDVSEGMPRNQQGWTASIDVNIIDVGTSNALLWGLTLGIFPSYSKEVISLDLTLIHPNGRKFVKTKSKSRERYSSWLFFPVSIFQSFTTHYTDPGLAFLCLVEAIYDLEKNGDLKE